MEELRVAICENDKYFSQIKQEILATEDMRLVGIFTMMPKESSDIYLNDMALWKDKIDVVIICDGKELHQRIPDMAKYFNIVDVFDRRATNPAYLKALDESAKENENVVLMFRVEKILTIEGVSDAIQYITDKGRECYIVAEDDADTDEIWYQVMVMYEDEENIEIHFITEEELSKKKVTYMHKEGNGIEYLLKMNCSAKCVATLIVSFGKTVYEINKMRRFGVKIPFENTSEKE